jgi:DNA helicase-2/ATP-dependent DNA helicase PcrA
MRQYRETGNGNRNVSVLWWNDSVTTYTPGQLARVLGMPEPTTEQAAVIGAPLGPLAVIAGAGSGKSETMAARLVWLVANGMVRADRVLGLTFTRKAAAELADRVRSRLDRLYRAGLADVQAGAEAEPVISTYHAYAGRLVSDHALREGLEPSMRLITPALSWQLAASIVAAYDGPMDAVQWTPQTVTAAVLQLTGDLAEHLRTPDEVRAEGEWLARQQAALPGKVPAAVRRVLETQRSREQLLPLVDRYAAAKKAREVLDHGDQVELAARIAARHAEVGAAERGRYHVVLLDEYQDTSHAQLVLLRALFGGGHPVTAVGDPCQSIYGWRGASAGNLRRFTHDFPTRSGGQAPVCLLSTSFRNTGRVLDAAARLQAELRAEAPDVPLLVPAPGRSDRGSVTAALLPTSVDEADWVADQAAALLALPAGSAPDGRPWPPSGMGGSSLPAWGAPAPHSSSLPAWGAPAPHSPSLPAWGAPAPHSPRPPSPPDGQPVGVRPSDIAVLCRKRSQFTEIRRALEERSIPCEVVGLGGLLSVPEVQDVVATLRVLHDAAASDALARLLTGPRWRIGPRDLVALGRRARDLARGVDERDPADPVPVADEPADALTEALTDLTAETGSLVEALDDLGDPAGYSVSGHARLRALAGELRYLREHVSRPLADLIAEVERTLSLDIEVAARPGGDLATARADLDAFTDVAATFAGDQPEPTLGAFLAYLAAAQQEEFGLETGRVGESDTVKLLTVHAAKGLQWPAVFVPGLAAGDRSQVFPARPRVSTRWTDNARLIPFRLRGDVADLPSLASLEADALEAFTAACAARDLAEERRLGYVAATRAAFWLGCSGFWWGEATAPLGPSVFLTEVRQACEAAAAEPRAGELMAGEPGAVKTGRPGPAAMTVAAWAERPAEDAENPLLAEADEAEWPATPAGQYYAAVREAAGLVQAAGIARAEDATEDELTEDELTEQERELVAAWELDAGLLLAERGRQRERGDGPVEVLLPDRLSVSALVVLARDPDELARQVRRPMPQPPARQARRGTAFHLWLEERFGQQRLIDDDDLFSQEDEDPDENLIELKARFEAGEWGGRWPRETEVPFDMLIGERQIRGRIDAVFADAAADSADGGFDVVDWKTGRPPRGEAEKEAVAVQLAAYRLAWSALADVPLARVRAAFYYVRHDRTVRPADLLDGAGLVALINAVPVAG